MQNKKNIKKFIGLTLAVILTFALIPMNLTVKAENEFEIKDGVLIKYHGKGGDVVIPDGITEIVDNAFFMCSNLKSVIIPDGVTEIGHYAFYRCYALESISLPDSLTYIGICAFTWCSSLKNITIPSNVTTISESAFSSCENFTNLVIPVNVKNIGRKAFKSCINLESVSIYSSVSSIELMTFYACLKLKNVSIYSSTLTIIGEGAFSGCHNLSSITIPASVTTIEKGAFYQCSDNLTIYGESKSYSETYAKENKMKFQETPKTGDPIGDVLYSDITAYINGNAIPTSVIDGKTLVVVEYLAKYGFDIKWDGNERTLKVELNKNKKITPLIVERNTTHKPGTFNCNYLYTEIKTYLSGEVVESYAIDGRTLIDFELLTIYGKLIWNSKAREIRLAIE